MEVKEYVDILVNVKGINVEVTIYIAELRVVYDLLLSRRWAEGIGVLEDYSTQELSLNYNRIKRTMYLTPNSLLCDS